MSYTRILSGSLRGQTKEGPYIEYHEGVDTRETEEIEEYAERSGNYYETTYETRELGQTIDVNIDQAVDLDLADGKLDGRFQGSRIRTKEEIIEVADRRTAEALDAADGAIDGNYYSSEITTSGKYSSGPVIEVKERRSYGYGGRKAVEEVIEVNDGYTAKRLDEADGRIDGAYYGTDIEYKREYDTYTSGNDRYGRAGSSGYKSSDYKYSTYESGDKYANDYKPSSYSKTSYISGGSTYSSKQGDSKLFGDKYSSYLEKYGGSGTTGTSSSLVVSSPVTTTYTSSYISPSKIEYAGDSESVIRQLKKQVSLLEERSARLEGERDALQRGRGVSPTDATLRAEVARLTQELREERERNRIAMLSTNQRIQHLLDKQSRSSANDDLSKETQELLNLQRRLLQEKDEEIRNLSQLAAANKEQIAILVSQLNIAEVEDIVTSNVDSKLLEYADHRLNTSGAFSTTSPSHQITYGNTSPGGGYSSLSYQQHPDRVSTSSPTGVSSTGYTLNGRIQDNSMIKPGTGTSKYTNNQYQTTTTTTGPGRLSTMPTLSVGDRASLTRLDLSDGIADGKFRGISIKEDSRNTTTAVHAGSRNMAMRLDASDGIVDGKYYGVSIDEQQISGPQTSTFNTAGNYGASSTTFNTNSSYNTNSNYVTGGTNYNTSGLPAPLGTTGFATSGTGYTNSGTGAAYGNYGTTGAGTNYTSGSTITSGTTATAAVPKKGTLSILCVGGGGWKDGDFITKCDPYCQISFAGQNQKTKTHKSGGKNAKWNQTLTFNSVPLSGILRVDVMDEDTIGRDDVLGQGSIDLAQALVGHEVKVPLKPAGFITLKVTSR